MSAIDASDYRERKDRDRDRASPPINGTSATPGIGSNTDPQLQRRSSRNIRMSNIESSVTRLLVATKQLIETLTAWSRREASETDVSDVYVRLGNEFNVARTCFERAGIDMTDLADIPNQLRNVLETCLSRDASPRILEIYLPKVREIVINLLQGLKRKQSIYRARPHVDNISSPVISEDPETQHKRMQSVELRDPSPVPKDPVVGNGRRASPARRPVGTPREESLDRKRSRETTRSTELLQQQRSQSAGSQTMGQRGAVSEGRPSNDALQRLQTSDALQRRASKRYSAYHIAKLDGLDPETGKAPPVPTRRSGSYTPEVRGSPQLNRITSRQSQDPSRIISGTVSPVPEEGNLTFWQIVDVDLNSRSSSQPPSERPTTTRESGQQSGSTSPEKIPVFLQLGKSIRKTLVSTTDLTLQALRLLFVDKFQYNPGVEEFPDILVTDRETGERYIFEDVNQDIVAGTTLTLDIEGILSLAGEGLIEVDSALKKTFTDGMTTILQEMANLQQTIADQQTLISRLTEQHTSLREELTSHRHETIRKIEDISLKTPPPTTTSFPQSFQSQLSTLKSLKRDLTTLKSEHNALITSTQSSITSLRNLPFSDTVKIVNSDSLASQKSDLEQKTQSLVTLSDDLSDQVDDLRIDITQKRIRPHPRQITSVRKQEASVQKQLESVEALLKTLRPMWKKKWEEELQQVIDGQEFLRHQETLITDLRKDLADTQNVMAQIVQAAELFETAQPREWLSGGIGSGGRDAVLGEVKTVQPNSAERVEAIKRAEKARQRDLELRRESEFQLELGEVVNESKLRNLGESALRIEREREEKEKQLRQQMWENEKDKERLKTNGRSLEEKDKEKVVGGANVKRAVSEGSSSLAEANSAKTESDDGVTRSQSYTSGLLSRMMRVGSATAKRWSGGELAKKASIHEDQVEDTTEDDRAGVGRNTDDG